MSQTDDLIHAHMDEGSEIERFLSNDVLYILVFAASGFLLLLSSQSHTSIFRGMFFWFYEKALVATLISYLYLKVVRRRRYRHDEEHGLRVAAVWLGKVLFGSLWVIVFLGWMDDVIGIEDALAIPVFLIVTTALAIYLAFRAYQKERYWLNQASGYFPLFFTDGLAWAVTFAGIGIMALFDIVYLALLSLDIIGIRPV